MILVDMTPIPYAHMAGVQGQRTENSGGVEWTAVKMQNSQITRLDSHQLLSPPTPLPHVDTSKTEC